MEQVTGHTLAELPVKFHDYLLTAFAIGVPVADAREAHAQQQRQQERTLRMAAVAAQYQVTGHPAYGHINGPPGQTVPETRDAFRLLLLLSEQQRGLVLCWFCGSCYRYVGPRDICHCNNDE